MFPQTTHPGTQIEPITRGGGGGDLGHHCLPRNAIGEGHVIHL